MLAIDSFWPPPYQTISKSMKLDKKMTKIMAGKSNPPAMSSEDLGEAIQL